MSRFILDCSVTMSWCFEDEATKYTDSVLDHLSATEALVPALWALEVANTLLVGERKSRITPVQSLNFLELLESLPITIDEQTVKKIAKDTLSLAREYRLSSYDACYLELALRHRLPLATKDTDLKKAAKKCGVYLN